MGAFAVPPYRQDYPSVRLQIESLQVMRGIAAVAVAFYHVYIILMQPEYGAQVVFQSVARHGFLGVSFFFVLSGFTIALAHHKDIGRPHAISKYFKRRFLRVYPVYWVYLTGFIAAAAVGLGHPDFSWAPLNLVSAYMLVPLDEAMTLPLKVAWTLVYEIRFYVLFALFILAAHFAAMLFGFWAITIVALLVTGNSPEHGIFSVWNLYFIAGLVAYFWLYRLPWFMGYLLLFAGVSSASIYVLQSPEVTRISDLSNQSQWLQIFLIATFVFIVVGAALLEKRYGVKYPRPLLWLGEASYSIYLVHSAAISVFMIIIAKSGLSGWFPVELTFLIAFCFSVSAGAIAYVVIERPLLQHANRFRG